MNPRMSAGREMDALVGREVMGFAVYRYDKDRAENCYFMLMDADFNPVVPGRAGERKTEQDAWGDCPAYSTDIAAAWQVVEKLSEQHGVTLYRFADEPIGETEIWHCRFIPMAAYSVTASTAPLAICQAALRAVEMIGTRDEWDA